MARRLRLSRYKGKSMRLGGGGRFAKLKEELKRKGVKNPAALAAWIGRKKYGAKKFQELSARARARGGRVGLFDYPPRYLGRSGRGPRAALGICPRLNKSETGMMSKLFDFPVFSLEGLPRKRL